MDVASLKLFSEETPRRLGLLNQARLFVSLFGYAWLLFCLFGVLVLKLGVRATFIGLTAFRHLQTVQGVTTDIEETGWSVNGSEQLLVWFQFEVDGRTFTNRSYALSAYLELNQPVDVEYVRGNPNLARIQGCDYQKSTVLVLVCLGLALFFGGVCLYASRSIPLWMRLLARGKYMTAELVDRTATGLSVGDQVVHKHTFLFKDQRGDSHQLVVNSFRLPNITRKTLPGVYDPQRPEKSFLFDQLPFAITMSRPGYFDPPKNLVGFLLYLLIILGASCWLIVRSSEYFLA